MTRARDLRLQRLAEHLHALDPRALYEFLREAADGAEVLERLERYSRLDPVAMATEKARGRA